MLQMNNCEPRRFWSRRSDPLFDAHDAELLDTELPRFDLSDIDMADIDIDGADMALEALEASSLPGHDVALCIACEEPTDIDAEGLAFCTRCREWSRKSNLDEHYDDLGVAG